jgi:hypothetical protein
MSDVQKLIEQEIEAMEASSDQPDRADRAKPIRKNRGEILSLRLRPEELEELTAAAEAKGVPVSTLARSLVVQGLRPQPEPVPLELTIKRAVYQAMTDLDLALVMDNDDTAPAAETDPGHSTSTYIMLATMQDLDAATPAALRLRAVRGHHGDVTKHPSERSTDQPMPE